MCDPKDQQKFDFAETLGAWELANLRRTRSVGFFCDGREQREQYLDELTSIIRTCTTQGSRWPGDKLVPPHDVAGFNALFTLVITPRSYEE